MNIQELSTQNNPTASFNLIEKHSQDSILEMEFQIQSTVTDIIREIGVPAHVKGYCYLRTAIILATENPEITYAMTKELYPAVAKRYNTTAQRVERAIRHAVELAWDTGNTEILSQYFSYRIKKNFDKPTNSEVIANISDRVRLKLKIQQ